MKEQHVFKTFADSLADALRTQYEVDVMKFSCAATGRQNSCKHIQRYDFLLQHSLTSFCEAQQVIVQYIDPLIFLAKNVTKSILKIPSKVNFCVYVSLIYRDKGINIVIVTSINSQNQCGYGLLCCSTNFFWQWKTMLSKNEEYYKLCCNCCTNSIMTILK